MMVGSGLPSGFGRVFWARQGQGRRRRTDLRRRADPAVEGSFAARSLGSVAERGEGCSAVRWRCRRRARSDPRWRGRAGPICVSACEHSRDAGSPPHKDEDPRRQVAQIQRLRRKTNRSRSGPNSRNSLLPVSAATAVPKPRAAMAAVALRIVGEGQKVCHRMAEDAGVADALLALVVACAHRSA